MAFETLFDANNANVFKFEAHGAVLEGYYMGSFDHTGDYGPTKKHVFKTDKGAEIIFGQRHLMQQLPTVKAGTMVRITYNDDLPPKAKGRSPMKLFLIEQDRKNTIDVVGTDPNPVYAKEAEDLDSDNFEPVEEATDEVDYTPPKAPARAAQAPSAARQQQVKDLLSGKSRKAA